MEQDDNFLALGRRRGKPGPIRAREPAQLLDRICLRWRDLDAERALGLDSPTGRAGEERTGQSDVAECLAGGIGQKLAWLDGYDPPIGLSPTPGRRLLKSRVVKILEDRVLDLPPSCVGKVQSLTGRDHRLPRSTLLAARQS